MAGLADEGMLYKAKETLRVFARRRPSVRGLLANRRQQFDRLHAILPADVVAGEPVTATVHAWDQCERLLEGFSGPVRLGSTDPDASVPDRVGFPPRNRGLETVSDITFETPGIRYLTLEVDGDRFVSNPVRVHQATPDVQTFWGDIHLHTRLSDGCGTPRDHYRFGRDVMDLDVVAVTDHDTMGFFIPPSWQRRRMHRSSFDRLKDTARAFYDPGEYVTLFGYEWTKQPNVGGHINVYFDDVDGAVLYDSMDERSDTYEKLLERVREYNDRAEGAAVAVPHHTAEATFAFDFSDMEYDDSVAPLVEVYSQWGSSERSGREGNRHPVLMGQGEAEEPGHYVQDALALGHRVGLMASADFHGPRPGHSLLHTDPHLPSLSEWRQGGLGWGLIWRVWNEPSYPGGLIAFRAPELTREAIFDALSSRRVYGTSQPHRILVDFAVDDVAVGERDSTVSVSGVDAERTVEFSVAGTAPVARVTVVKNNEPWVVREGTNDAGADLEQYVLADEIADDEPVTGMAWDDDRGTDADVYYLRVRQADGGMAWAGPLWVAVG